MDRWVPSGLRQDQRVFIEPSYFGSLGTRISIDPLPGGAETSMGCMLGQLTTPNQKERATYYLSKKFTTYEINHITIENTCYALMCALHKSWQCMLYYTTRLISCIDPIMYIFEKLIVWAVWCSRACTAVICARHTLRCNTYSQWWCSWSHKWWTSCLSSKSPFLSDWA